MPPAMKIRRFQLFLCIAGLVLAVSAVTRADDIKKIQPAGYVTDLAGILTPQAKAQLEALGTELEQKTGAQMAIVTVKSLDGQEIEPYANDLFQHLRVGKKKEETGVMLLVAPNERKYRTEVGYGLEPVINDARAGDAARLMVPYFRQGDYSAGVTAAAWQLANYIAESKGVTLSGAPQHRTQPAEQEGSHLGLYIFLAILLIFIFSSMASGGSNRINRGGDGGMGTGLLIGSLLGSMNRGGRGGWDSGSWGGGGWGGSGGGFGGFGGGSSGGGGASGSW
jgi:uncharacterized protein